MTGPDAIRLLRRDQEETRRARGAAPEQPVSRESRPDEPPDPGIQRLADRIIGATDRIRAALADRTRTLKTWTERARFPAARHV
jgi:hypothetical protein